MPELIVPGPVRDTAAMRGLWAVRKFWADDDVRRATPYEVVEAENALLTAGAATLWEKLTGAGSAAVFSSANARLCVGDSSAAVAAGQTDLQASTNKLRTLVDAAPVITGANVSFVATFTTAEANFAWNEAGCANAASGGILLNRVVQSFGTKTSSVQWVLTFSGTFTTG